MDVDFRSHMAIGFDPIPHKVVPLQYSNYRYNPHKP